MSTPVTVPAAVAPEDHNEHVDRLKVGRLEADTMIVGSRGTLIGTPWLEITPSFVNATLGTGSSKVLRFSVIGKTCHYQLFAGQSANGVCSGTIQLRLPVRAAATNNAFSNFGNGTLLTSGATHLVGMLGVDATGTLVQIMTLTGGAVGGAVLASNLTANTDPFAQALWQLAVSGSYEIA